MGREGAADYDQEYANNNWYIDMYLNTAVYDLQWSIENFYIDIIDSRLDD